VVKTSAAATTTPAIATLPTTFEDIFGLIFSDVHGFVFDASRAGLESTTTSARQRPLRHSSDSLGSGGGGASAVAAAAGTADGASLRTDDSSSAVSSSRPAGLLHVARAGAVLPSSMQNLLRCGGAVAERVAWICGWATSFRRLPLGPEGIQFNPVRYISFQPIYSSLSSISFRPLCYTQSPPL
jgi:hypothetical protein